MNEIGESAAIYDFTVDSGADSAAFGYHSSALQGRSALALYDKWQFPDGAPTREASCISGL